MLGYAIDYKNRVSQSRGLWTVRPDVWQEMRKDAKWRYEVWKTLTAMVDNYDNRLDIANIAYMRRVCIEDLIKLLGERDYLLARWPHPYPPEFIFRELVREKE